MDTTVVEQLSIEKAQLRAQAQSLLTMLAVVALAQGKPNKKGNVEYRLTRSQVNRINGRAVTVHTLKSGVVVVEVAVAPTPDPSTS